MAAYLTVMAISAGIYALLALGVNLTWGMAGMVRLPPRRPGLVWR